MDVGLESQMSQTGKDGRFCTLKDNLKDMDQYSTRTSFHNVYAKHDTKTSLIYLHVTHIPSISLSNSP